MTAWQNVTIKLTHHTKGANTRVILALTLVHFMGDFYNAFITPLLPLFIDKFSLTLAQAGLVTGLSRFLAFSDIFMIRPVLTVIAIVPVLTVVPVVFLFSKDPSALRA